MAVLNEFVRERFLANLKGPKGYKRYRGLPLRYGGGKTLAVGHVMERLPAGISKVVSPFFGGGSVEFACALELGLEVIGYDIFDLLTNYWTHQIKDPEALADKISEFGPLTRESFWDNRLVAKAHWEGETVIEDELELAARFWYCHNMSYGPGFPGWISSNYLKKETFDRALAKVRDFRAAGVGVNQGNFKDVLPNHADDFCFVDPPYLLSADSKMFAGMYPSRNYPTNHVGFDHEGLRDLLRHHKGGFIMTYNDCPTIRNWYADCKIEEIAFQYTMGQGETRIGKNRKNDSGDNIKQSHEILISKFKV